MKTERLFIGKINKMFRKPGRNGLCVAVTENMDNNVLLIIVNRKKKTYFSPRYKEFFDNLEVNDNNNFISEIRQFNYKDLQSYEHVGFFEALKIYKEYKHDLVYSKDLYLCEVREKIRDGINDNSSQNDYQVISPMTLVRRIGDDAYFSPKFYRTLHIRPIENGDYYVANPCLFEYENIQNQEQVTFSDAKLIYRKYLNSLNNKII